MHPHPHNEPSNKNQTRILWGLAALIAVVLVVLVIALVSRFGADDSTPAAVTGTDGTVAAAATATTGTDRVGPKVLDARKYTKAAVFKEGSARANARLELTGSVDLPASFAPIAAAQARKDLEVTIKQQQDRALIVMFHGDEIGVEYAEIDSGFTKATLTDGVKTQDLYDVTALQAPTTGGMMDVRTGSEAIPDSARGMEDHQVRVMVAKPDAYDPAHQRVFLAIAGVPKIFTAKLVRNTI